MKELRTLTSRGLATRIAVLTAISMIATSGMAAIDITPDFGDVPNGWVTDRYQPNHFGNVGAYQGRDNVLGIGITSAEGMGNRANGQNSQFYNTQGMQHALAGGAGTMISADLWIPTAWADPANGSIRTDIWGVMSHGTNVTAYPILGFTTYGGASRFRVWDGNTADGWVDLATSVAYNAWNSLAIEFTGSAFVFSVNGSVVYTDATTDGTTGFSAIIMQAYNFYGDTSLTGSTPVDYTAYWSNTPVVPEPATYLAGALMLLPFGTSLIRRLKSTRRG